MERLYLQHAKQGAFTFSTGVGGGGATDLAGDALVLRPVRHGLHRSRIAVTVHQLNLAGLSNSSGARCRPQVSR